MVRIMIIIGVILLFFNRSYGQTGIVSGKVVDLKGNAIPGAVAILNDERFLAKTDTSGRFIMVGVPEGTYQMYVVANSYFPNIVKELHVRSGEHLFIGVTLAQTIDLEDNLGKRYRMPFYVPDTSIHYK